MDADWFHQNIKTKYIVLDSSIPFWRIEELKKICSSLGVPVHVVQEEGAFVMDM